MSFTLRLRGENGTKRRHPLAKRATGPRSMADKNSTTFPRAICVHTHHSRYTRAKPGSTARKGRHSGTKVKAAPVSVSFTPGRATPNCANIDRKLSLFAAMMSKFAVVL